MTTAVVYVHGLWLTGLEGGLLRRRLARQLTADTYAFTYPSVRADISANAASLNRFLSTLRADTMHLVGHSLGGLVILNAFENRGGCQWPPGRIVLLGSPLQGSLTAQRVARVALGRAILGAGVSQELVFAQPRQWNGSRDLGVIAGTRSVGLGRLVGKHDSPSDGTVFLKETRLPGAAEHLSVAVSHTGLPFSREVARQAGAFLEYGRFSR